VSNIAIAEKRRQTKQKKWLNFLDPAEINNLFFLSQIGADDI